MVERRLVRIAVGRGGPFYYIQDGRQLGITYETAKQFEKFLNKRFSTAGASKILVATVPMTPDRVIEAVADGQADIAGGALTVTDERSAILDFAEPWVSEVKEVVVMGPDTRIVAGIEDLAGREVVVRVSSSYYESLVSLNEDFEERGLAPIQVVPAHEVFSDGDLLEMTSVGMISLTVTDDYYADFWSQVFTDLNVRHDLAIREGGELAWGIRKKSPKLKQAIGDFVRQSRPGTRLGNIVLKRYLDNPAKIVNALEGQRLERLSTEAEFFRKYGEETGFDWLQLAAQGFQESRLDNTKTSPAGAVGIMQVLPSTARMMGEKDFRSMEGNIRVGAHYMRHLIDQYFADPEIDRLNRWLLALASYNAGATRINRLRREAAEAELDPNLWFDNVERIVARRVGSETVNYVRSVMKYYLAYRLAFEREQLRQEVLSRFSGDG